MRHAPLSTRPVETRLARALIASAAGKGLAMVVEHQCAHPWASATFEGYRHDLTLAAPRDPRLGGWVSSLPQAELPMHGHLVASVAVEAIVDDGVTVRLTLSALTIVAD